MTVRFQPCDTPTFVLIPLSASGCVTYWLDQNHIKWEHLYLNRLPTDDKFQAAWDKAATYFNEHYYGNAVRDDITNTDCMAYMVYTDPQPVYDFAQLAEFDNDTHDESIQIYDDFAYAQMMEYTKKYGIME